MIPKHERQNTRLGQFLEQGYGRTCGDGCVNGQSFILHPDLLLQVGSYCTLTHANLSEETDDTSQIGRNSMSYFIDMAVVPTEKRLGKGGDDAFSK